MIGRGTGGGRDVQTERRAAELGALPLERKCCPIRRERGRAGGARLLPLADHVQAADRGRPKHGRGQQSDKNGESVHRFRG
jgi:hypothetical protein